MNKTREEKARIAIDITTKNLVESAKKGGYELTDSQARKKAQEIAERVERKREK